MLRPHCANTYEQLGNKSAFSFQSYTGVLIKFCCVGFLSWQAVKLLARPPETVKIVYSLLGWIYFDFVSHLIVQSLFSDVILL